MMSMRVCYLTVAYTLLNHTVLLAELLDSFCATLYEKIKKQTIIIIIIIMITWLCNWGEGSKSGDGCDEQDDDVDDADERWSGKNDN